MQKKFNLGSMARSFLSGFQATDLPVTPAAAPALIEKIEPKPETVEQSLVTINAMAKAQGLETIEVSNDALKTGHFKGVVVAVSAHHALIKNTEGAVILMGNDSLSRVVKLGERLQFDLANSRMGDGRAQGIEQAEVKQAPPPPKPHRELVELGV